MCLVANVQRSVRYPANAEEIGKGRGRPQSGPDFQRQYEEKGKANGGKFCRKSACSDGYLQARAEARHIVEPACEPAPQKGW
jgi:hypothetical protein